jgi:hypothetical protein
LASGWLLLLLLGARASAALWRLPLVNMLGMVNMVYTCW